MGGEMTMKRLMLVWVMMLCLVSGLCTAKESVAELNYNPECLAPDRFESDEIWFCNRFSSVGNPPFSLPEATEYPNGYYRYSYTGVSREYYDSFLSELTADDFSLVTMKYSDFLFRDDCMVFSKYNNEDGFYSVSWYQKSPWAPDNGLSDEEASSILMPDEDDSLSRIPIHPIDITPEGFHERTGGQIFAVPYYSYDSFRHSGQDSLMFEDNERYGCSVRCVIGDRSYATSMESIAVYDVDQDGSNEVLLLSFGPTSGLFTFNVMCVTSQGVYDTIFCTEYYRLAFAGLNGKLVIEGVGYDSIHHYFDIRLVEDKGESIVMLYGEDESLTLWGIPNTRNFTDLSKIEQGDE